MSRSLLTLFLDLILDLDSLSDINPSILVPASQTYIWIRTVDELNVLLYHYSIYLVLLTLFYLSVW